MAVLMALSDVKQYLTQTRRTETNLWDAAHAIGNRPISDWCLVADVLRKDEPASTAALGMRQMTIECPDVPRVRLEHLKAIKIRFLTDEELEAQEAE